MELLNLHSFMACRGTNLSLPVLVSFDINLPSSASLRFYFSVKNRVINLILTTAFSWKSPSTPSLPLFCSSQVGNQLVKIQPSYIIYIIYNILYNILKLMKEKVKINF